MILSNSFMRGTRTLAIFTCAGLFACAPIPAHKDPWNAPDKYAHAAISAVLGATVTQASLNDGAAECDALRRGAGVTLTIGVGKEIVDAEIRRKGWSWRDLVADATGAVVGSLLISGCR